MNTFTYERWRHGGWYVCDIRYPSGAVGCVSRNYTDRKWRVVCLNTGPGSPDDRTFPNREAAAAAEWEIAKAEWAETRGSMKYRLYQEVAAALPAEMVEKLSTYAHVDVALRVACLDSR